MYACRTMTKSGNGSNLGNSGEYGINAGVLANSAGQVIICAERCRGTVAAQRIVSGDDELSVTISIGIAEKTADMSGPDDMLKQADSALYEAKRSGRNCTIVHGGPALQVAS